MQQSKFDCLKTLVLGLLLGGILLYVVSSRLMSEYFDIVDPGAKNRRVLYLKSYKYGTYCSYENLTMAECTENFPSADQTGLTQGYFAAHVKQEYKNFVKSSVNSSKSEILDPSTTHQRPK